MRIALLTALLAVFSVLFARVDPSPAGEGIPVRRPVWVDNFTGRAGASPSATRWGFDTGGGGWGSQELEYYTSRRRNARLDGHGHVQITARAESFTGPDGVTREYTSARLQTLHTFRFQYGLAEARIEVPAGQGLLPAFWMLGSDAYKPGGWPASGEIDAMEISGAHPTILRGTLHGPWPFAPAGMRVSTRAPTPLSSGFHVYGVQWAPEAISFLLDGVVYGTITPADLPQGAPWPFQHPFFLLLDLAVGGASVGAPGPLTRFPAKLLVDWVKVWQ
ncbi:MAG TPA: glycoside hydrolase family 16 protein [Solirubrobacteraceae bacterium]|nr:glycoside hydrolase family 16 protein [Solirubrobacteraceae bacterium]